MKFDENTKVSDILKDPDATAVVSKYIPGFKTHPALSMVVGMTLKQVAAMPMAGISPEVAKAIITDLAKLG